MKCRYSNCKRNCTDRCQAENSYCPSNGTEGMSFIEDFCAQCMFDNPDPDKKPKCEILTATLLYYPTDPEYPKEWIYGVDGHPKCTKFISWNWDDGDPNDPDNPKRMPDPPDPRQLNLFPLYHPELTPYESLITHP